MKDEILSKVHDYKFKGEYLNNYRLLLEILREVTDNIDRIEFKNIGIHLVLESRNHRWGMAYSKAFELASDLNREITEETQRLVEKLPKEFRPALTFLNEQQTMHKNQLKNNPHNSWIWFAEPWRFFIFETEDSARLFVNDFNNGLVTEIETDDFFNWNISNPTRRLNLEVHFPFDDKPKTYQTEVEFTATNELEPKPAWVENVDSKAVLRLNVDYPKVGQTT